MSRRDPWLASRAFDGARIDEEAAEGLARLLGQTLSRRSGRDAGRRAQRERSLLGWARHYLPRHFTRAPSAMHLWLEEQLVGPGQSGRRINVIGPRGGAKSTIGTLAWPLWLALVCREPYIWIVSDTRHQARAHLTNIRLELEDNELLAADYPGASGRGTVWREAAIALAGGTTIEAFGTGQRMRGRRRRAHRPTTIICDDLENDQHIASPQLRAKSRGWFHGTLLQAGTRRTNVVNLATALHRDSLAMHLARTAGWISRTFPAIVRWPDRLDLWAEWEAIYARPENPEARQRAREFYLARRAAMEAGAELLWPDQEDLYTLMCLRAASGRTAFEREKQGVPLAAELCEWPESYFGPWIWSSSPPPAEAVRTLALDPSKGADARLGDYAALVALSLDSRGIFHVDADLSRRPLAETVAETVQWCRRCRPAALGVEANQFQQLLCDELAAALEGVGLVGLPVFALTNQAPKVVRIRRLAPLLAQRRLRFKVGSPGTRLLVEQLQDFPLGDHDDGPDALEMAVRLADELLSGQRCDDGLGARIDVGR